MSAKQIYYSGNEVLVFTIIPFLIQVPGISTTILLLQLLMVSVFAYDLGDLGSIPGRIIPKTQNMVLDASLLDTQQYKVRI